MTNLLTNLKIDKNQSLETVASIIRAGGVHLALVIDESGLLEGVVSDGDVRRAILKGTSLQSPVEAILNRAPVVVNQSAPPAKILALMEKHMISAIPIVDDEGHIISVETLRNHATSEHLNFKHAFICAGGEGLRLRPFTANKPKPMVSIGNRTLIERVISNLAESGVEKVYVSLNYLGDQIRDHLKQAPEKNLEIEFVEEKSKLGTAGALGLVNYDLDEPLLVINGDILTSVDLSSLYFFHRQGDCVITVGIVEYLMKIPYGVITFADNRVAQLVEKPSHCVHINAGIYVIDPNLLSTIPENTRVDMTDIIETALQNGEKVTPFPIFEQWIDIGTPEDLERANDLMRLEE